MILVLNCGSSSVKWAVKTFGGTPPARESVGLIERVGEPGGPADHEAALRQVFEAVSSVEIAAIGHRVVHGGTRFREPTLIDDKVVAAIEELTPLAPLHNPANLTGIRVALALRPGLPQIAVFDTAFHTTMPPAAYTYALDLEVAEAHGVRRYGFHGTSHRYVSRRTAELLGRPVAELNTIVLHLGNGASATAVAGGRSVETSMGMTPLEGLVMGTRSGDVDPAVAFHLERSGLALSDISDIYERRGGLRGLCGDNDMRAVLARRDAGDPAAALAVDAYCHRLRKYVGAYYAVLGRLDAIAFTAGVGENAAPIRALALAGLAALGIAVDPALNTAPSRDARVISPSDAAVAVCVVPTDEEQAIAEETAALIASGRR